MGVEAGRTQIYMSVSDRWERDGARERREQTVAAYCKYDCNYTDTHTHTQQQTHTKALISQPVGIIVMIIYSPYILRSDNVAMAA